ncbi:hypothetical protein Tco_1112084 [Tanacetum coccineum]|uniref:Uncharacterized protein n=1 Tax=Tanacetum coccineum TaxID=301880 RepID=A0ABQ5IPN8_9ASTR
MARQCSHPKRPRNAAWFKEKLMLAEAQEAAFQTEDMDAYDSDCDDLSSAKPVLMVNLSSCDPEVLSKYSKQTHIDDFQDNEIHSDSNIILYSQYLQESQDMVIRDTNSSAPNDLLVLSLVEQMTDHVAHLDKENQINKMVNESLTVELERYKERVAIFKQRFNVDLNKHEKLIDSQMDDFIRNRNAKLAAFQQEIDTLKETLSNNVKEKESLSKTLTRTTSDAITAGAWGFEHTKACFVTEIIPFLKVLKDTFNAFDKTLSDEIELSIDNDQLLKQIMSQEIVHIVVNSVDNLDVKKSCVNECNKCLELETELLKKKDLIEKDDNFRENKNAPAFNQLFELNELKAQLQEKDTVIRKLKDRIKSLSGTDSVENVKNDIDEIETINIELEHSVAKLLLENENLKKEREHLKSIYKYQFDSIRKTHVQSKEHCDSLIAQVNAKSVENSHLNAQLQEKVFAIAALKNELRKLKEKNVVDIVVLKPNATIAPGMFKLDIEPISHRLKNNRDAHEVYIEKTIKNTDTLRGFVERARTQNPSEPLLESSCMFTKHVQELLVYVSQTCPNSPKPSEKLVAVTPMNKDKRVRFAESVTSSSNIAKLTDSLKIKDSNKHLLTSTGVKPTTIASG